MDLLALLRRNRIMVFKVRKIRRFRLSVRTGRNIDADDRRLVDEIHEKCKVVPNEPGPFDEREPAVLILRRADRDRLHPVDRRFTGGSDRTGVENIGGDVVAMVDSTDHHIGFFAKETDAEA